MFTNQHWREANTRTELRGPGCLESLLYAGPADPGRFFVGCRTMPVCLKADRAAVTGCLQIGELRLPVNKPLVHRRPDNVSIRTFHCVLYMTVVKRGLSSGASIHWETRPVHQS